MRLALTTLALLFLLLPSLLVAQPGAAAPDRLGRVELPNQGAPEAQAPFLRGLAALHSFWYDEAADLFREAQRIDPDFALAYWGEALTHNHPLWDQYDGAAGREALERLAATPAERAAKATTELERDYLETAEVLYDTSHADKAARDHAYSETWRRLHEKYPDDLEAKSFYALSLQGLPRTGDARLHMRSGALMEEVFAANPLHPGAAHYLIHAYDDPIHAPLGLRAAEVYADIAPAANHALHMPSHIFVQLGLWPRVAASNIDAYEASVAWVERRDHPLEKRDFHSLSWLQYAYLQMGQFEKAAETIETIRPVAQASSEFRTRRSYNAMLAAQVVETGRVHQPGLAFTADGLSDHGAGDGDHCATPSFGTGGELTSFAEGWAAALTGDLEAARQAADSLEQLAGEDERPQQRTRRLLLAALLASAEGRGDEAIDLAAEALEVELSLRPPSGPPDTFKPAHELSGELLLAAGRHDEAAEMFRQSLLRTPKRTASVLGAARAAEALGQRDEAGKHYAQLLENLANSDRGHPAVAEARDYLEQDQEERQAP